MTKEEIKIRTSLQQKREEYLLLNKSKAEITNILIDTEEYVGQLEAMMDKAIKYLEEPNRDNFDFSKCKLLEILKGEE